MVCFVKFYDPTIKCNIILTLSTSRMSALSVDILARGSTPTYWPIHVRKTNFCRLDISSPICMRM